MGGEVDDSGPLVSDTARPDHPNERDSPTNMSATIPATPASSGLLEQRGGSDFSRRDLLKRAGMLGAAAAAVQVGGLASAGAAEPARKVAQARAAMSARESLETLTAAESDMLEAIVARLIPTDENGPGAAEARAAHYIDRALTGPLASSRAAYAVGLAAVDAYARASKGAPFAKLSAKAQDSILSDMEKNIATGFTPNSAAFFSLLRTHTIEGTFCDPYYGGNASFVGWDLIGYPGVRLAVGPDQQRMGAKQKPTHWSAYDYDMFLKVANRGGMSHGR
jgi:gluconate 2-dehydrogenase gamma chain